MPHRNVHVCVLREGELELGLNEGVRLSRLEKDRDGGVASWVMDTAVAENTYVVYECYVKKGPYRGSVVCCSTGCPYHGRWLEAGYGMIPPVFLFMQSDDMCLCRRLDRAVGPTS